MPRKSPFSKLSREHILQLASAVRLSILNLRISAGDHFKVYEPVQKKTQRLLEDCDDLIKELKETKPEE
jgi:DNA-directed RNA polymerase subunit L